MNRFALASTLAMVMGDGAGAMPASSSSEMARTLCDEAARIVNAGELDTRLKLAQYNMDWIFPDGSSHKLETQRDGNGSCPSTFLIETHGERQRIKWTAMFVGGDGDRRLVEYFNMHWVGNLLDEPVVLSQGLPEVNRGYLLSSFRAGKLAPLCELKPNRANTSRTILKSNDSGLCAAIETGKLPLLKWIPTSTSLMQSAAAPGAGPVAPETLTVTVDGKSQSLAVGRFSSSWGRCPGDGRYLSPVDATTYREQPQDTVVPWRDEFGTGSDGSVGYKQDNDLPGFVEYRRRDYLLSADVNDHGHLLVLPLTIPTQMAICELRLQQVHPVMTKH